MKLYCIKNIFESNAPVVENTNPYLSQCHCKKKSFKPRWPLSLLLRSSLRSRTKVRLSCPGAVHLWGKDKLGQTIEDNRGKRKEAMWMKSVGKLGSGWRWKGAKSMSSLLKITLHWAAGKKEKEQKSLFWICDMFGAKHVFIWKTFQNNLTYIGRKASIGHFWPALLMDSF